MPFFSLVQKEPDPAHDQDINFFYSSRMFKALGEDPRTRMLGLLIQGELCYVCVKE